MINVNIEETWKPVIIPYSKISGFYKRHLQGWYKTGDTWKRFFPNIPPTMIVFFTSTIPDYWKILNGIDASPDLIGNQVYLRGGTTEGGSEAGSNTHQHGAYSGSSSTDTSMAAIGIQGGTAGSALEYYHNHTINHTHGSINNEPSYHALIPAIGNGPIPPNISVLFWDGTLESIPSEWAAYSTIYDKFIKCSSSPGGTGGALNHSHSITTNTGSTGGTLIAKGLTGGCALSSSSHAHSMDHTHTGGQNDPGYYSIIPILSQRWISKISPGVCAFFIGSSVPLGWTLHATIQNGKFIKCSNVAGNSGGANNHSHTLSGYTGYVSLGYSNMACDGVNLSQPTHRHILSHSHDTQNNIPLHRVLMVCKKN